MILPQEVISHLQVEEGDTVALDAGADGYRLSAYDPEVARQVEVAKKIMRKYRNTLRELAK